MPNRFQIGQCVTYRSQPTARSLVFSKQVTSAGRGLYQLRAVSIEDPQRDRIALSEALTSTCDCSGCRFASPGGCMATVEAV